jgi:hypothetical protein
MTTSGKGTNGKKLWFRTPDHRWIAVPYGAGQDSQVRSLNIFDGTNWQVPAWGWWLANKAGLDPTSNQFNLAFPSDGFFVQAPGVSWLGRDQDAANPLAHAFNPNYGQIAYSDFLFGRAANYLNTKVQLFNTEQRNDPNWRIVPIGGAVDKQGAALPQYPVGNHYQNPYDPYHYTGFDYGRSFWPALSYASYKASTAQLSSGPIQNSHPVTWTGNVTVAAATNQGDYGSPDDSTSGALVIDLQSIRKQLHDTFPEQGVYYQGQYTHIDKMFLKRVYLKAVITCSVGLTGGGQNPTTGQFAAVDTSPTNGITFTVTANTNTPVSSPNTVTDIYNFWPGEAQLRYPLDVSQSGPAIFTKVVNSAEVNINQFGDAATWQYFGDLPAFEFEGPGEDNIKLACAVTGVPTIEAAGFSSLDTNITVYLQRVALQYATANHDVPSDLKRYDALG